jgi:germination protein YpeB
MKRITRIIAACAAGVLVVGLSVYAIVLSDRNARLQNQITAVYQKAFNELTTDVASLQTKLLKLEAAGDSAQYSALLMDAWRQTGDTESSISALPVSYTATSPLMQFVNRAGDYCRYLSQKIALGQEITADDMAQVRSLADTCGEITRAIEEIRVQGYPTGEGLAQTAFLSDQPMEGNLDFTNQEFPRLIYDGPFSESTENKQPEGLSSETVTAQQAAATAAQFLGVDASTLTNNSDQEGTMPAYGFTGEQNGRAFSICVTKQGGQVLYYMRDAVGGISAIPTAERSAALTAIAQQYCADKGYGETAPSYAQYYNGMALINLAPVQDGTVLYPDLLKVWVDIPTNTVVGLDAYNYLMSHKQRDLPEITFTEQQAKDEVTARMAVESARLALIPLDTNEEKLCWELKGTVNGNDYLIFINVTSGAEEDILMIQHVNDGTLVM